MDNPSTHGKSTATTWSSRISLIIALAVSLAPNTLHAQEGNANFKLAARFAPYKIDELIYSTSVSPNWIEKSESFWYKWETSEGATYYIVDPVKGQKREVFNNDRIASELSRITKDPWDAKHLGIEKIKFISDKTLRFDVTSSQDEELEADDITEEDTEVDQEEKKESKGKEKPKKKIFHFEYDIASQVLRELQDWEEPDNHPSWASISPDGKTVVFGRNYNLWSMSWEDYDRILKSRIGKTGDDADKAEKDVVVAEIQLTTDGEEHYSYAFDGQGTDTEKEKRRMTANVPVFHGLMTPPDFLLAGVTSER